MHRLFRASRLALACSLVAIAAPALAQRADENAVKEADDAFGVTVGNENLGLYNAYDARGFSPVDAGNTRINGLYFFQQGDPPTNHISDGSAIRIGIAAQGYPLPAPTGIADYSMRRPAAKPLTSIYAQLGPYADTRLSLDHQGGLGEGLTVAGGVDFAHNEVGGAAKQYSVTAGATLLWQPSPGVEIQPFYEYAWAWGRQADPLIVSGGDYLPERIDRRTFYGLDWTERAADLDIGGVLAKVELGQVTLRAGAFVSGFTQKHGFYDLLLNADPDGFADRVVIADPDARFRAKSGELRASWTLPTGKRRHVLHLIARGRDQTRRFGGSDVLELGRSRVGVRQDIAKPNVQYGPQSHDRLRQGTLALAYEGQPLDWLALSGGVQRTHYTKRSVTPGEDVAKALDKRWLTSIAAAVEVTESLAIYGSHTTGLEEGGVAPDNAANKGVAAPALITKQIDAGVRYAITGDLKLVVGAFDVRKPYFALDPANTYRRLGTIRQQGVEISLAGQITPALRVVAGAVLVDPTISGEEVASGLIGKRPVGQVRRLVIASADYTLPGFKDLTLNATVTSISSRMVNARNTLAIPARSVLDMGARYRFTLGDAQASLNARLSNVFNTFGWRTGGSGLLTPNDTRRFSLALAVDV